MLLEKKATFALRQVRSREYKYAHVIYARTCVFAVGTDLREGIAPPCCTRLFCRGFQMESYVSWLTILETILTISRLILMTVTLFMIGLLPYCSQCGDL